VVIAALLEDSFVLNAELPYWESSSSAGAEESWFNQYIREPRFRPMLQDDGGFQALLVEHDSMYTDYIHIGKHIENFKRWDPCLPSIEGYYSMLFDNRLGAPLPD
jgi:hypothetical protein